MALQRATIVGTGNVIEAYDTFADNKGTYSVWYGPRQKYFQPPHADFESNLEMLKTVLTSWEQMDDSTLYYLRVHPDGLRSEVINDKTPYTVDFPFRVVALPENAVRAGLVTGMPYGFQETIKSLNDRIAELESEQEPEQNGFLGQLSGLLENPQVVETISTALGTIVQRILGSVMPPPQPQQNFQPVQRLNGMENVQQQQQQQQPAQIDPVRLDATLVRLSKHIDLNKHLDQLADYLDKNPGNVPMILSFLK